MCPYMHLFSIDGYVIGHYANNARDFMYPAVPPYPGSGRELTLFKTSLFNPIRITVSFMFTCGWCTCSALYVPRYIGGKFASLISISQLRMFTRSEKTNVSETTTKQLCVLEMK